MTGQTRQTTIAFWLGAAGVLIGIVGISLADSTAWLKFFDNLHWTSATLAAAVLCWLAAEYASSTRRPACRWFAAGTGGYALGQIIWDIQQWLGYSEFPSPSDAFYLWLGPCLAIGIYRAIAPEISPARRNLFLLDCAILVTAAVSLVLVLYLPKRGDTAWFPMAVLIAYPASLLVALGMAIIAIPTRRLRPSLPLLLFLIGLAATGWSWMTWNSLALDGVTIDGVWFNPSFSVAILLLGAAITRLEFESWEQSKWERICEAWLRLLPLLAVVIAALAVMAAQGMDGLPVAVVDITDVGAVVVVILAVIRQHELLREFDRLLRAETSLKLERLFSNAIIEGLPGAFLLLDDQGYIRKHNTHLSKFIGDSGREPLHVSRLLSPLSALDFDDRLRTVREWGVGEFELELVQPSGVGIAHGFSFTGIDFDNSCYLMGIGIDITDLKAAMAKIDEARKFLYQVVETIPSRIYWKDRQLRYLGCNSRFAFDAGLEKPEDIVGKRDSELVWADMAGNLEDDDLAIMATSTPKLAFETELTVTHGEKLWIRGSKVPLNNVNNDLQGVLGIYDDITERKRLEDTQKLAALVFEHSREAIIVTDEENRTLTINPAFTRLTGYEEDDVVGKNPRFLRSGKHDDGFYQAMWKSIRERDYWEGEVWDRRKNGEMYPQRLSVSVIRDQNGEVFRHVGIGADISDKKQAEQIIWRQANFDALTNLPNRRMLADRMDHEIKRAHRGKYKLAVLFLDLDHFKDVNDSLGHHMGDVLLTEAALRMRGCIRESDTLARLGGDEFAILVPGADLSDIERVSNAILGKITSPFFLDKDQAFVSASIGIAFYPDDAADADELLKKADQAMYAAKHAGRACFNYFEPQMQEKAMLHLRLAADMRSALGHGEFALYFQPIVELNSGHTDKAEALLRWRHPLFGYIAPDKFIPIAESNGFIHELGNWVFDEALKWGERWTGLRGKHFVNSVNLSPVQLMRGNGEDGWIRRFGATNLGANGLVLEITEGVLLNDNTEVTDKLMLFKNAGMQISMDDFGTGYSSLSYLNKFPIDYLKIDKSFIRDIATTAAYHSLVEAIIVMAHKLKVRVIAEGVETQAQQHLLMAADCDFGQGYLFSKPLPAEEFERLFIIRPDAEGSSS